MPCGNAKCRNRNLCELNVTDEVDFRECPMFDKIEDLLMDALPFYDKDEDFGEEDFGEDDFQDGAL